MPFSTGRASCSIFVSDKYGSKFVPLSQIRTCLRSGMTLTFSTGNHLLPHRWDTGRLPRFWRSADAWYLGHAFESSSDWNDSSQSMIECLDCLPWFPRIVRILWRQFDWYQVCVALLVRQAMEVLDEKRWFVLPPVSAAINWRDCLPWLPSLIASNRSTATIRMIDQANWLLICGELKLEIFW